MFWEKICCKIVERATIYVFTNFQTFLSIYAILLCWWALIRYYSFCRLYGSRKGFKCHLLRYFLLVNWEQNLFISPQEFLVLAAWVLGSGSHDTEQHRRMRIVPSPRCATVENWFLVLFRSAYAFLACFKTIMSFLCLNQCFLVQHGLLITQAWL